MSRLTIRLRLTGKKNQLFVRFILVPKKVSQKGPYIKTLGYCDMKPNALKVRYVVLNIYELLDVLYYGAQPTRQAFERIFKFFLDSYYDLHWFNSLLVDFMIILENEIKKKYL